MDILQNITLVLYFDNIILNRPEEQEMVSILEAMVRHMNSKRWEENSMNIRGPNTSMKFLRWTLKMKGHLLQSEEQIIEIYTCALKIESPKLSKPLWVLEEANFLLAITSVSNVEVCPTSVASSGSSLWCKQLCYFGHTTWQILYY